MSGAGDSGQINAEVLAAINRGIKKASKRANGNGEFDGLCGSLPNGASIVLSDIIAYLRRYLLDDRGLTRKEIRRIAAGRSVSQGAQDEGVLVALGVLNSIASVIKVRDDQHRLDGQPLSKSDAIVLLLAGRGGLRHHRHMEQQRKHAKKASESHSEARQRQEAAWLPVARALREKHPDWSNAKLATEVARTKEVTASVSTIRQALRKHGLSK